MYAGGPLSERIGAQLVEAGVPLYSWYGGTEFGAPTRIFDAVEPSGDGEKRKTKAEWQWMEFPVENVNVRWVPEGNGSCELQFLVSNPFSSTKFLPSDCRSLRRRDVAARGRPPPAATTGRRRGTTVSFSSCITLPCHRV